MSREIKPKHSCWCAASDTCDWQRRQDVYNANLSCKMNAIRGKSHDIHDHEMRRVSGPPDVKPLDATLADRGKEYGDFSKMCARIQRIKRAMFFKETPVTDDFSIDSKLNHFQREGLELIATKIGRILTGNPNNEDSWRDIAGYATKVLEQIIKNKKTAPIPGLEALKQAPGRPMIVDPTGKQPPRYLDPVLDQIIELEPGVVPCPTGGFHYTGDKGYPYRVWLPDVQRANGFAKATNNRESYDV